MIVDEALCYSCEGNIGWFTCFVVVVVAVASSRLGDVAKKMGIGKKRCLDSSGFYVQVL